MDAKLSSYFFVLVYLVYINLDGCPIGKFVELSISSLVLVQLPP